MVKVNNGEEDETDRLIPPGSVQATYDTVDT